MRIFLGVLILLFVSISKSKPFGVLEISNFIVSVNSLLNPIPTGNRLNQPIYSYHVTQVGRNRVNETATLVGHLDAKQH